MPLNPQYSGENTLNFSHSGRESLSPSDLASGGRGWDSGYGGNFSEQPRQIKTLSRSSNKDHIGERQVLRPLGQKCFACSIRTSIC